MTRRKHPVNALGARTPGYHLGKVERYGKDIAG
jgi:hypothetical protein